MSAMSRIFPGLVILQEEYSQSISDAVERKLFLPHGRDERG